MVLFTIINQKDAAEKTDPIPEWATFIVQRLLEQGILKQEPDQMIINEYMPGQGIAMHTDNTKSFADGIVSVSLGSPIVMDFKHWKNGKTHEHVLQPCSALSMYGQARYDWAHGIGARYSDYGESRKRRVSMTFRKMK